MNTIAAFLYKSDCLSVSDFRYHNQYAGSNTSFCVQVHSNGFSGIAPFECDITQFRTFVEELEEMYNFKRNDVTLNDTSYGSTVSFVIDRVGNMEICGELFGEAMIHQLKFTFTADQTSLKDFVFKLKNFIKLI